MAGKDSQSIDGVIEEILDYQVDGIIAASVALSSDLSERCRAVGVPMVLFNRDQDDLLISSVTSDNITGGRKVAELFLASGHKKIDDGKCLRHPWPRKEISFPSPPNP